MSSPSVDKSTLDTNRRPQTMYLFLWIHETIYSKEARNTFPITTFYSNFWHDTIPVPSSSSSPLPALHVRSPSTSSHLWLPQASASRPRDRQTDRQPFRLGRQWVAVGEKFSLPNWSLRHDKAASLCNKCVLMGHRSSAFTSTACCLETAGCCSPLRGFKVELNHDKTRWRRQRE